MDITRLKALLDEIEAEQEVILTRLQLLEPIIVYQMGKVASTTVCETLKNHGFKNILHAHSINPALISKKKHKEMKRGVNRFFLHETAGMYIAATGLVHKSKVISLVRDPVARNISAFFQNYQFKHEDFG